MQSKDMSDVEEGLRILREIRAMEAQKRLQALPEHMPSSPKRARGDGAVGRDPRDDNAQQARPRNADPAEHSR